MQNKFPRALVWFRRDLRSIDHAALYQALTRSEQVYCVFVFDRAILQGLPATDRRVLFIHDSVRELALELKKLGGALIVRHAYAEQEIPKLAAELNVEAVFANHDYEPQAMQRDLAVQKNLASFACTLHTCKDQVIFEKDEVLSQAGTPFSVFTPYKNTWLKKMYAEGGDFYCKSYPIASHASRFAACPDAAIPSLAEMCFTDSVDARMAVPAGMSGGAELLEDFLSRIRQYDVSRDFPAVKGPSYLSVHLRFGTVSIRHLVREALYRIRTETANRGAQAWL